MDGRGEKGTREVKTKHKEVVIDFGNELPPKTVTFAFSFVTIGKLQRNNFGL